MIFIVQDLLDDHRKLLRIIGSQAANGQVWNMIVVQVGKWHIRSNLRFGSPLHVDLRLGQLGRHGPREQLLAGGCQRIGVTNEDHKSQRMQRRLTANLVAQLCCGQRIGDLNKPMSLGPSMLDPGL